MNKKNKAMGGFSPFIFMLFILLLYWFVFRIGSNENVMTNAEFTKVLQEGQIESVIVEQIENHI